VGLVVSFSFHSFFPFPPVFFSFLSCLSFLS
jgi:hypothetical protein